MTGSKIKILFIGLGGIGQRHLRNIHAKFGNNASILAYRARGLRKTVTPNLTIDENVDFIEKNSVEVFTDLNEALNQEPDVAFICNPTSHHMSSCLAAAEAGCDFFVEKPLSHSIEGVKRLQTICNEKKLICHVGYQLRFHPCYILVRKLIEDNATGNILSVHSEVGEYLPDWHKYEDYRQMYASKRELGGGVVLSQIHEIDYLYDLFGIPKRVFAMGGHLSNLEIDVEDTADVLMEMNFRKRSFPVSLHLDYIQRPPSRSCKIIGDLGKILMDFVNLKVIIEKPDADTKLYDFRGFDRNELFTKEIDHFFECVLIRRQPIVSLNDGVNSLKIALSIKKSIELGETISPQNFYEGNHENKQVI